MGKEAIISRAEKTAEFFVYEEIAPDREYFDWKEDQGGEGENKKGKKLKKLFGKK